MENTVPADRRAIDLRWKDEITGQIKALQDGHGNLNAEVQSLRAGQTSLAGDIAANTSITLQAKAAIEQHAARTAPLMESWDSLQSGIQTLGKIGHAGATTARWAAKAFKPVVIVIASALFMKHLLHGEGLEAAVAAFTRVIEGK